MVGSGEPRRRANQAASSLIARAFFFSSAACSAEVSRRFAIAETATVTTMGAIADVTMDEDSSAQISIEMPASFIGPCDASQLSYLSSNTALVAAADAVIFSGTFPRCTITISPAADLHGISTITLKSANNAIAATRDFNVKVLSVNDIPALNNTINNTVLIVTDGASTAITLESASDADVDTDNQTLEYILLAEPAHGTLSTFPTNGLSGGTVTYQAASNFTGTDSFSYSICDSATPAACSNVVTVNLSIPDTTSPTVTLGLPSAVQAKSTSIITYPVVFTGATTYSLSEAGVALTKTGTADCASKTVSNETTATPTVALSLCSGDGTVGITIDAATASDSAGNTNGASAPSVTFTVDNTAPTVSVGSPTPAGPVNSGTSVSYSVSYLGGTAVNLANSDVTLNKTGNADCAIGVTNGTTTDPLVTLSSCSGDGTVGITINAATASDAAGNTNSASAASTTFTVENTPPNVVITSPNGGVDYTTDTSTPTLAGTCNSGVVSLSLSTNSNAVFTNNCASNGTWSVQASLNWQATTYTVTARNAANAAASDSITLTRTIIIGQSGYAANKTLFNYGNRTAQGMRIWSDGSKLAVTDSTRNRVLLFNTIPTSPSTLPDVILGQSSFEAQTSGCTASSLNSPTSVTFDGNWLWVADANNNRLLGWAGWPSSHGQAATRVLGQASFVSCNANQGGSVAASTLRTPASVWSSGSVLVATDTGNNRILVWNSNISSDGQNANIVLGQGVFTSATSGRTATTMASPLCAGGDGTLFFVCDTGNARFLIWNSIAALSNGVAADRVLGAANMTAYDLSSPEVRIRKPSSFAVLGTTLYISDLDDHAVRVFDNYTSLASGAAASRIVGQTFFANSGLQNCGLATPSATCLRFPDGVAIVGSNLFVGDHGNARILSWNTADIVSNGVAASGVLGASSLTHGTRFAASGLPLSGPTGVATAGTKVAVVDRFNRRVLLYNTIPTSPYDVPSVVLGQDSLMSARFYFPPTASSFSDPWGVATDGTRLFVSDVANHRILVWASWPTTNNQAADYVLGQASFTGGSLATTQSRLNSPRGLSLSDNKLAVADFSNNRVLIWDDVTAINANSFPASRVIGQSLFTSNTSGTTSSTLRNPVGVLLTANSLTVSDQGNHRVLHWSSQPATGAAASKVLGQGSFTDGTANRGSTVSAATMNLPAGLAIASAKLFVADGGNHRILAWNDFANAADGQNADFSLGQFTTSDSTGGLSLPGVSGLAFNGTTLLAVSAGRSNFSYWGTAPAAQAEAPQFASTVGASWIHSGRINGTTLSFSDAFPEVIEGKLFISDRYNNRILVYNSLPQQNNPTPDWVIGQSDFVSNGVNSGGLSGLSLFQPMKAYYARGKFFLVDAMNHRVLVWNGVPDSGNDAPDIVLGQPSFHTNIPNIGPGLKSMNIPTHVVVIGTKLIVSEWSNNRILIWDDVDTITSFQAADRVLGQDSGVGMMANKGGARSISSLHNVARICSNGNDLVAGDTGNKRLLVWRNLESVAQFGSLASVVLGQPDFVTNTQASQPSASSSSFFQSCAFSSTGKLYGADFGNSRVLSWNSPDALANGQAADGVWGQPDFVSSVFSGAYSATNLPVRGVNIASDASRGEVFFVLSGLPPSGYNDLVAGRILMMPLP